MLKVPKLDDVTYEQMMQRAVSRIPSMTEEWTDYNQHDPGITVLQMYAWLTDMLDYYMSATGDVHIEKYLKLLGIEPEEGKPASGHVVVEGLPAGTMLSAGTRFLAGTIPYETVQDYEIYENRFCAFLNEVDGILMDLTAFAGKDGDYAECFSEKFEQEAAVWFWFEKPLLKGDGLYICIETDEKRNPFGDSFRLCDLTWQIYTEQGWVEVSVKDETCGFLRSGFVWPEMIGEMDKFLEPSLGRKGYVIRAVLKENRYDCLPRIGMVYVNPLQVVQKATVCKEGEILPELRIGQTDGCAGQALLFDYPDVWNFSLLLLGADGEPVIWRRVKSFVEAGYADQVFVYEEEQQQIRFGDGIHGMVPPQKQSVYVTGLSCSLYEAGNVQAGELKTFAKMQETACRVYNPMPLDGGAYREQLKDMISRMEESVFAQKRMASEEDYEQIIGSTPGLRIERVHVIPGTAYGRLYRRKRDHNEVVAVVKPWSRETCPQLGDVYEETIRQYMEPFRLINTKVSIVSPAYVGIEIYGRITLQNASEQEKQRVISWLTEQIHHAGGAKKFGAVISSGKLFAGLEMLPGVVRVQELNLERIGNGAEKDDRGDLHLQEDALAYLKKIELEFV